jgi:hypothetical protein
LTGWWRRKELSEKMEGGGGGEAQGVADQKKNEVKQFDSKPMHAVSTLPV